MGGHCVSYRYIKTRQMKRYEVIKMTKWKTSVLREMVENFINDKASEGYEIISVSLGKDANDYATAFVTIAKGQREF